MARKARIEFAGAVYHVIGRGDRGEAICQDDEDRRLLLQFLGQVCERTERLIRVFVVMTNHCHILLETREANLVEGMKWLQRTYIQRFNLRHELRGSRLFHDHFLVYSASGERKR